MGRDVAIKVLPRSLSAKEDLLLRFQDEARAMARLNHPNIVAGYEVGESNGMHYFSMEYVQGDSVESMITATSSRRTF